MRDDRNMYFGGTQQDMMGAGVGPQMMGPSMGAGMGPQMMGPGMGPGMMPNVNQIENRLAIMERQIRKLESRISRLETPFQGNASQYPSSSLKGEEQQFTYPYQTSMQVM